MIWGKLFRGFFSSGKNYLGKGFGKQMCKLFAADGTVAAAHCHYNHCISTKSSTLLPVQPLSQDCHHFSFFSYIFSSLFSSINQVSFSSALSAGISFSLFSSISRHFVLSLQLYQPVFRSLSSALSAGILVSLFSSISRYGVLSLQFYKPVF